jgi:hypothetical protein
LSSIPKVLTLFLSLSFGHVVDWRERFREDMLFCLPFWAVESDIDLAQFVDATLTVTFG